MTSISDRCCLSFNHECFQEEFVCLKQIFFCTNKLVDPNWNCIVLCIFRRLNVREHSIVLFWAFILILFLLPPTFFSMKIFTVFCRLTFAVESKPRSKPIALIWRICYSFFSFLWSVNFIYFTDFHTCRRASGMSVALLRSICCIFCLGLSIWHMAFVALFNGSKSTRYY